MTRLPAPAHLISYVEEEMTDYELPTECAHPACDFPAMEAHHIVRRSHTQGKGPQDWICIEDVPVPNKVGLCRLHHEMLTENKARLEWVKGEFLHGFQWLENGDFIGFVDPVPLGAGVSDPPEAWPPLSGDSTTGDARAEREDNQQKGGLAPLRPTEDASSSRSTFAPPQEPEAADPPPASGSSPECPHPSLEPGERCSCGYKKPHPKKDTSPASKVIGTRVPTDEVDAFKEVMDAAAEHLGLEKQPYWTFRLQSLSYALVLQDAKLKGFAKR